MTWFTVAEALCRRICCPTHPATASTLNSVLMRHHELREGIEVVDENGAVVGTSTVAAKRVGYVWRTCTSDDPLPIGDSIVVDHYPFIVLSHHHHHHMYNIHAQYIGCDRDCHHKVLPASTHTGHTTYCHDMAGKVSIYVDL